MTHYIMSQGICFKVDCAIYVTAGATTLGKDCKNFFINISRMCIDLVLADQICYAAAEQVNLLQIIKLKVNIVVLGNISNVMIMRILSVKPVL